MAPLPAETPGFSAAVAQRAVRRGVISVLAFVLLIAAVVVAVANTDVGAAHVADIRQRMSMAALVASTTLMSAAFVFMGLRWRALLPEGNRPPVFGLSAIILAGLLLNYALPGPMGELGAAWFAHRRYRVPLADALATGVTARIIGLATAALLAAVVWTVTDVPAVEGTKTLIIAATSLIAVGGLALSVLAVRPQVWQRLATWMLGPMLRGPPRIAGLTQRLLDAVNSIANAIAGVVHRGLRPMLAAAGWSIGGHLTVTTGIAIAIGGLDAVFDIAGLAFTYAATTAGAVALFALPGSQLGWDALFVTLLVWTTGLTEPDAVAVAMLIRLQQLGYMLVGALVVGWLIHTDTGAPQEG